MSEEDAEYDLVMPFVVVASKGGPYDDDAYVAGWEMGGLDEALRCKPSSHDAMVRTGNAVQADLVAMKHGYVCTSEEYREAPEWTIVSFRPIDDQGGSR